MKTEMRSEITSLFWLSYVVFLSSEICPLGIVHHFRNGKSLCHSVLRRQNSPDIRRTQWQPAQTGRLGLPDKQVQQLMLRSTYSDCMLSANCPPSLYCWRFVFFTSLASNASVFSRTALMSRQRLKEMLDHYATIWNIVRIWGFRLLFQAMDNYTNKQWKFFSFFLFLFLFHLLLR